MFAVMPPRPPAWKFAVVAMLLVAAGVFGLWWLARYDFNVRLAIDAGIDFLRSGGPWVFFGAMAVLPSLGFPVLVFHLTAGPAFAAELGLPRVLACAGAAILSNLALSYWLSRYGMRPLLEQLISRTRFRIPTLERGEHAELTLLLRITPGPPFFVQSYILGLAGVRFGTYLWISWVVSMAYATGFIIFGDAILHGKARLAIVGLSAIAAVVIIVHLIRRHYGRKRA